MKALPLVILLGDSIRLRYQAAVTASLAGIARVDGPADNCGDSRQLLANLDAWVIARRPAIVHVNCGLHDIKREHGGQGTAVSLAAYERNVRAILARLRRDSVVESAADIVWAMTTPVIDERHAAHKAFDRREADVRAFNEVAGRVAAQAGVPVNNLHEVVERHGPALLLAYDGIHFTDAGCQVLGTAVADFLRKRLQASEALT